MLFGHDVRDRVHELSRRPADGRRGRRGRLHLQFGGGDAASRGVAERDRARPVRVRAAGSRRAGLAGAAGRLRTVSGAARGARAATDATRPVAGTARGRLPRRRPDRVESLHRRHRRGARHGDHQPAGDHRGAAGLAGARRAAAPLAAARQPGDARRARTCRRPGEHRRIRGGSAARRGVRRHRGRAVFGLHPPAAAGRGRRAPGGDAVRGDRGGDGGGHRDRPAAARLPARARLAGAWLAGAARAHLSGARLAAAHGLHAAAAGLAGRRAAAGAACRFCHARRGVPARTAVRGAAGGGGGDARRRAARGPRQAGAGRT
jgi:hypothetical protein